MAENETLDLGGAYAQRWDAFFDSVRKGASCVDAARKVEKALYSGLGRTLKQLQEYGVSLAELLAIRGDPRALRQFNRKTQGHQYVQLFAAAAASSGDSQSECLRGWVDAIFDKMSDQICHRVAGKENWPAINDVQRFMQEVRKSLEPAVERIVSNLEKDPAWKPRRAASKERAPANPTAELLGMSLLGAVKP